MIDTGCVPTLSHAPGSCLAAGNTLTRRVPWNGAQVENVRRKHNYIPFAVQLFKVWCAGCECLCQCGRRDGYVSACVFSGDVLMAGCGLGAPVVCTYVAL